MCVFVGWCSLNSEAQAAWVQALGSVAAIGVAIGVAWWQQHQTIRRLREDTARRMDIVRQRMVSTLQTFGTQADQLAALLRRDLTALTDEQLLDLHHRLILWDSDVRAWQDHLHEMDHKTIRASIELLAKCDQYQELHGRMHNKSGNELRTMFQNWGSSLRLLLERISRLGYEASTAIRLFEERAGRKIS